MGGPDAPAAQSATLADPARWRRNHLCDVSATSHYPATGSLGKNIGRAMTWVVVQTQSRSEHVVRVLLMRLCYETYLPRIKHRGRIAPLFANYLFVRIVDQWYPIRRIPYVIRIIMAGEQPAALPETFLTDLRKRERKGFVQLPPPLRRGQKVLVSRGTFMGHVGIYAGMSGKQRESILLQLLGRTVEVELPAGNLRVAVG